MLKDLEPNFNFTYGSTILRNACNNGYFQKNLFLIDLVVPLNVSTQSLYEGHYLNVLQHCGGGDLSLRHIMGNTDAPLSALLLSSQQCYSGMTMASSMYW